MTSKVISIAGLAFRSTHGRVVVVPGPVAIIGIASLLLATLLAAFDPPEIRASVLDRQAVALSRWESAERARAEKTLARLEPQIRRLRRVALHAGIPPVLRVSCEGLPAEHAAAHVDEAARLAEAIAARPGAPPPADVLPWRAPIDFSSGWVVSEHGRAPNGVHLSSKKGSRSDPFTGRRKEHHGLDLSAPSGTPVIAPGTGTVVFAGSVDPNVDHGRALLGKHVILRHGPEKKGADVYLTLFAHLASVDVKSGQVLKAGDRLGAVGSTGRSTAPHLHYQVMRGEGAARQNLDPLLFITDAILVRDGDSVWYVPEETR